ncbi:MAG: DUF2516 family protein [Acidimicrobiales bacterium]|jgi:hypothetical protein
MAKGLTVLRTILTVEVHEASASGMGVFFLIVLGSLVVSIWAIVDAARTPTEAFLAAGSSKGMWITLIALLTLFTCIVGCILAIVYLTSIRSRVRAVHLR